MKKLSIFILLIYIILFFSISSYASSTIQYNNKINFSNSGEAYIDLSSFSDAPIRHLSLSKNGENIPFTLLKTKTPNFSDYSTESIYDFEDITTNSKTLIIPSSEDKITNVTFHDLNKDVNYLVRVFEKLSETTFKEIDEHILISSTSNTYTLKSPTSSSLKFVFQDLDFKPLSQNSLRVTISRTNYSDSLVEYHNPIMVYKKSISNHDVFLFDFEKTSFIDHISSYDNILTISISQNGDVFREISKSKFNSGVQTRFLKLVYKNQSPLKPKFYKHKLLMKTNVKNVGEYDLSINAPLSPFISEKIKPLEFDTKNSFVITPSNYEKKSTIKKDTSNRYLFEIALACILFLIYPIILITKQISKKSIYSQYRT